MGKNKYQQYKESWRNGPVTTVKPAIVTEANHQAQATLQIHRRLAEIKTLIKQLKAERRELQQQLKPWKVAYREKPWQLYALRLEGGYWYVGMSRNPEQRFIKHRKGKGAVWTKLHKPIEIVEIRETDLLMESEASILEDEMTLQYARDYGTEIVRGGGYCQTKPRWPAELHEPDMKWVA